MAVDFLETGGRELIAFCVPLLLRIYLLPLSVAEKRLHHNHLAIGVLNILLGWTAFGWVGALVWSCTESRYSTASERERAAFMARMTRVSLPIVQFVFIIASLYIAYRMIIVHKQEFGYALLLFSALISFVLLKEYFRFSTLGLIRPWWWVFDVEANRFSHWIPNYGYRLVEKKFNAWSEYQKYAKDEFMCRVVCGVLRYDLKCELTYIEAIRSVLRNDSLGGPWTSLINKLDEKQQEIHRFLDFTKKHAEPIAAADGGGL